jgi:tetratricopeptide (TPR) repeat protein
MEPSRVQQIYQVTKGLPWYLNWIRERQERGDATPGGYLEERDFSEGNQKIVELLLQGFNAAQTLVIRIAACCRWFDRGVIQALMEQQQIDFQTAVDGQLNCFEWLTQKTFFVERVQGKFRLDDVARDVFHGALWEDDRDRFQQVHCQIADYFWQKSNQEVDPDSPPPERYNNPDWREYRIEFLYHLLFSRRADSQVQFLTHLLEARYFRQDELVKIPVEVVAAELDDPQQRRLPYAMQQFLLKIRPAVMHGWAVLEESPIDYEWNQNKLNLSKADIDQAVQVCLNSKQIETLNGLAKFAALFYKSKRCPEGQQLEWLLKAQTQAEQITTEADLEFSSGLFLWEIGIALSKLGQYEAAVACYDKAIEIKPNDYAAWFFRGTSLSCLGQQEAAIASYDKAVEIKPNFHEAWCSRGLVLSELEQDEAAIASYDKVVEIKPDDHNAWHHRGNALFNIGQQEAAIASYEEAIAIKPGDHESWFVRGLTLSALGQQEAAIASYEEAIAIQPDYCEAWGNRGNALSTLGQYEAAIASYDKVIETNPNDHKAHYNKALCYAFQDNQDAVIDSLQQAIELYPECREMAKTNTHFNGIRDNEQFQALIGS